jgi:DNA helicase-2/ATP-dependent DNA helicase PcrA
VQILTVHMSKGAEWDVVAVPGLAEGTFPGINKSDPDNWITNEKHIPFHLRGDRAELPHFLFNGATKNSEAKKAIDAYGKICNATKVREEIRLGYVAFTRARTHLIATTSWWRDGADWVAPSSIFEQVALVAQSSGVILNNASQPEDDAKNPKLENPETGIWPRDPLGEKRAEFDNKVKAVQSAAAIDLSKFSDTDLEVTSWVDDAKALINEVNRARSGGLEIALPLRLSTSTLVALHKDPVELALNIRRPMPRPQDEYSRRGTAFHLWIERHFMAATLFDDDDLDFLDPLEPDQTLDDLKAKWLASEWAMRIPVAVEVPFEAVIGPVLVRGRIDAVYEIDGRYEVIDWKTGSTKLGPSSAVQLAVYRLAWAKLKGIDPAQVSAAFHYVPSGQTDRSADLLTETELIKLLSL